MILNLKIKQQQNLVQNPKKSKTKKADPKLLLRQPLFFYATTLSLKHKKGYLNWIEIAFLLFS
jgi:hypothetical protein